MNSYFDRLCLCYLYLQDNTRLEIEGLRQTFKIEKTSTRTCNTASVDIYNLSKGRRDLINALGIGLEILTGYNDAGGPKMIFKGDLTYAKPKDRGLAKGGPSGRDHGLQVLSRHQGPDIITHLEAADGDKALRETLIEFSFSPETEVSQIVNGIVGAFAPHLSARPIPALSGKVFHKGFSFSGLAAECLDKICNAFDLEWSVQSHQIQILKRRTDNGSSAVLLSPGTGLIGSPERILDLAGALKDDPDAEPEVHLSDTVYKLKARKIKSGWKVTSLIQPQLEPGGVAVLKCSDIPVETPFRIWKITHEGDTHSGAFTSTIELVEREAA